MKLIGRWGVAARLAVCLIAAAATAGCRSTVESQGKSRTSAAYSTGTLSADLPSTVRVQAVIAAAESALRDRGYTIGTRRAAEDSGFVEGKLPRPGLLEKTKVEARVSGGGTRVLVKVEPWGDEAASRAILDDLLKRLGM
ncbi:MAG: DUF3568 family protein [Phycisphaerales bacterium]|nr:DUF3568 family protein [Phycisphaerales bacterium]